MNAEKQHPDRFLGLLGLCRRAGRVVCGAPLIEEALRSSRPPALVLVASDASEGAAKRLRTKCEFYRVPMLPTGYEKDVLARAVGKDGPLAAVAVMDAGIAKELLKSSGKDAPGATGNENM